MGLFDKKTCSICGAKIGLLGNRKLEDGNLCKDCAKKLSPWFEERRHSTVQSIQEQLRYREQNEEAVRRFHVSRSIGDYYKLLIDDAQRKFTVGCGSDPLSANPDILDFSQASGIELKIEEHNRELTRTVDGKQVSYNPRRFEYTYNFRGKIYVTGNPYFDEMSFGISNGPVNTGERNMSGAATTGGWKVTRPMTMDLGSKQYYKYLDIGNEMKQAIDEMRYVQQPSYGQPQMQYTAAQKPGLMSLPFDTIEMERAPEGFTIYTLKPAPTGMELYKVHLTGQIQYQIVNPQAYAMMGAEIKNRFLLTLQNVLLNGVPYVSAMDLPNHTGELLQLVESSVAMKDYSEYLGIKLTGITIAACETQSMRDEIQNLQNMAMAQNLAQPAPQPVPAAPAPQPQTSTGTWICPSCGGENNGKFCQYCGTPRP